MRINHNIMALNTHRQLTEGTNIASKNMEKLSSGLRINRAADDAAGLSISEKMRGQIRGLEQASKNAQDGISLIQTAEGALNETHAMLQRMRELTVQANNSTNNEDDLSEIQKEIVQLATEITETAERTEFNTQTLLTGDFTSKSIQIGANKDQTLEISFNDMRATALGSDDTDDGSGGTIPGLKIDDIDVGSDTQTFNERLNAIDAAIQAVSAERSQMGAWQNRLEHTINNLGTSAENLTAAESRIRDVDYTEAA